MTQGAYQRNWEELRAYQRELKIKCLKPEAPK